MAEVTKPQLTPRAAALRDPVDEPSPPGKGPSRQAASLFQARSLPVAVLLAGLTLLFCFRCYRTFRVFNETADEAIHIACGLEVWQSRQYTIEAQHPPLARMSLGVFPYLAGLRYSPHGELWTGASPEFYWHTLTLARLGNLVWAPFLIVYTYLWAKRLYGWRAGLGAAVLVSFCPNLMAHASVAALDFAAATTVFVSAYYLWRWAEEPGWEPTVMAAAAFSVAALVKFSALVMLPLIAAAFFLVARGKRWMNLLRGREAAHAREGWAAAAGRAALFLAVVALMIWAAYGFAVGKMGHRAFDPAMGSLAHTLEHRAQKLADVPLPAPQFWRGILDVAEHDAEGHPSYLLGRVSFFGWWYYFPVALAVKTTIPLLLLAALGIVIWAGRARGAAIYPLAAAALILSVCIRSHLNLGIRHILAIYPFFALLGAGLFEGAGLEKPVAKRALLALTLVLTGWHVAESFAAAPDYLAYFNELARGREDEFLLDSNLDWGQDLERLRLYLEEHRITTIYLSYFGKADPKAHGLTGVQKFTPEMRPNGWVAVSRNHIPGLGLEAHNFRWLKARRPAAEVGKSIVVYYLQDAQRSATEAQGP